MLAFWSKLIKMTPKRKDNSIAVWNQEKKKELTPMALVFKFILQRQINPNILYSGQPELSVCGGHN